MAKAPRSKKRKTKSYGASRGITRAEKQVMKTPSGRRRQRDQAHNSALVQSKRKPKKKR